MKAVVAAVLMCLAPGAARAQEAAITAAAASSAGTAAAVVAMPEAPLAVRVAGLELAVISRQPHLYHGWPTVAARRDGSLALVYSGGRDYHVCPFGRLEYMVSGDGGDTWSWPRTILDSLTDDRDSGFVETSRGVLLASFFTSIAYQQHLAAPERLLAKTFGAELDTTLARWRAAERGATQADRKADVGYWLLRSTDGGRTWSARLPAPGYCPHGPIALRDGRVFYAAADGKRAAAWVSEDDGLTWRHLADLPTRAGELHAVEAADGTLIVHVRDKVAGPGGGTVQRTLQTESRGRRPHLERGAFRGARLPVAPAAPARRHAGVHLRLAHAAAGDPFQDQPRPRSFLVGGATPHHGCAHLGSGLSQHGGTARRPPAHDLVRGARLQPPRRPPPGPLAARVRQGVRPLLVNIPPATGSRRPPFFPEAA